LLPLIERWRSQRLRVAVFGTGAHTDHLFTEVPELNTLNIVAFLESNPDREGTTFRGQPVHVPAWAEGNCDVVLCSSFAHEMAQMAVLDGALVKVVPSHVRSVSTGGSPFSAPISADTLQIPTFGYPITRPDDEARPFDALTIAFERDIEFMRASVNELLPYFSELEDVPCERTDDETPYWNNGYFTGTDASLAYAMVRRRRPGRIIEIGSGSSTKFMRRAIVKNGGGTHLTSIDPFPRAGIDRLCDGVIRTSLQDAPLETFDELRIGDILFFDGSHMVLPGSDCVQFFLRVLPNIPPGVFVQVHDIYLPFGYPKDFQPRYYSEQYLLGAFLLGNRGWRTVVPSAYLRSRGLLKDGNSSFWMVRER
jgi:hypothetical protein